MKRISINQLLKSEAKERIIIIIASVILIYFLVTLYFSNHFFINTEINGVNVSLKTQENAYSMIRNYVNDFELQLIERNGVIEKISGQSIGMQYNDKFNYNNIKHLQNSFLWLTSLVKGHKYYFNDLYLYDQERLLVKISNLNCLNEKMIIEPQNVDFLYSKGSYEVIEEVYGNKILKDKLIDTIKMSISKGITQFNLDINQCYENPKFTLNAAKTLETKNLLNKYVLTTIIYKFGSKIEIIDGNIIQEWLSKDENLDVVIDIAAVKKYVNQLSKKYDTVGTARKFNTSTGKLVEVKGGLYGWKINQSAETKAIVQSIKHGEIIEKEPVYTQKALSRDGNEIGNTYVEINITRQHLWFYKDGKLLTQGAVVTGNPNKGNATVLGTYMLNYKREGATLSGVDYEVKVLYWMPFFGNIGLHDASWRYSFGGEIYKRRGTHGCVNAPLYLAKTVFEHIEEGIPVICYEE